MFYYSSVLLLVFLVCFLVKAKHTIGLLNLLPLGASTIECWLTEDKFPSTLDYETKHPSIARKDSLIAHSFPQACPLFYKKNHLFFWNWPPWKIKLSEFHLWKTQLFINLLWFNSNYHKKYSKYILIETIQIVIYIL